jgi:hypothetical protein
MHRLQVRSSRAPLSGNVRSGLSRRSMHRIYRLWAKAAALRTALGLVPRRPPLSERTEDPAAARIRMIDQGRRAARRDAIARRFAAAEAKSAAVAGLATAKPPPSPPAGRSPVVWSELVFVSAGPDKSSPAKEAAAASAKESAGATAAAAEVEAKAAEAKVATADAACAESEFPFEGICPPPAAAAEAAAEATTLRPQAAASGGRPTKGGAAMRQRRRRRSPLPTISATTETQAARSADGDAGGVRSWGGGVRRGA